jgi:hypothetical protein
MPVQGFVRLRKHQFGRQSAWGNAEPATRAFPFSGVPSVVLNWTDPEGDFGSIVPIAPPYRLAPDLTANLTAPVVNYNDLPLMLAAALGNDESPTGGGAAKTWAWEILGITAEPFDLFTYEFGDDVLTDWYQLTEGILTQLTFTGPETGGPVTASMNWLFAHVASTGSTDSPVDGTVPTPALSVDANAVPVYVKDMSLFIDSAAGSIGSTQIVDALHNFDLTITVGVDQKRFVNGSQSFDIEEYGRTSMLVEFAATFAKTADTVGTGSESDSWMSDTAVNRFVRLSAESTEMAQTAGTPDIPYSWVIDMPLRYYTREEAEQDGNTTIVLTGRTFLETATLDHALETTVVNTLAATGIES